MSAFDPKRTIDMLFVSSYPKMATAMLLGLLIWCFGPGSLAVARTLGGPATKANTPHDGLLAREQALARAREVAVTDGRDLERYELDTFGDELTEDRSEWVFVFRCKPAPAPPGCHFMVVVDRRTGESQLFPGE
ncbi:hypothetical protein [Lysobacter soli]|uniref:Uncharacterized protein n=1 Tax=Lysobacter soli TaxID=453783 RepID=A0A3D8V7Q4_9GAMM|nr:hypothetical protein [Lysobacter soli]RDY65442.1 hypothetical protein DX912_17190 [Lysobacter soli]